MKKIVSAKANLKYMKKTVLILAMTIFAFVCAACEDYDDITYYNVIGEGYVFVYDTIGGNLYPLQDATIHVLTDLKNNPGGILGNSPEVGIYTTDAMGKYRIRFIKRTHKNDAEGYRIYIEYKKKNVEGWTSGRTQSFEVPIKDVKKAKKILALDTIKYERFKK